MTNNMKVWMLVVFILVASGTKVFSQCNFSVQLQEVIKSSNNQSNGEIKIEVSTDLEFEATLLTYDSKEKKVLQQKKGLGNSTIKFSNLKAWDYYTIKVEVAEAKDKLCKVRQISDVLIEEK